MPENSHNKGSNILEKSPVKVFDEEKEASTKKRKSFFSFSILNNVSLSEKVFFTKNLQVMLSGGLSLSRALQILSIQTRNKRFKNVLLDINERINKGESFSQALAKHSDIFSEIFRSMIQLSEETGTMEKNLDILSIQMDKEYELKSRIKGALIYPSVIVFSMIGIGILMLIVVVPELTKTFNEVGVSLPLSTQIVIGFTDLMFNYWYVLPFFVLTAYFLIRKASKTKRGKRFIDFLMLKTPFVSSVIKKTNSAYTARTLSSLLASGVPIIRGLEIISESLSNIYFKKAILDSITSVKKGDSLSKSLRSYSNLYSLLMIEMIEVGEETGETSKVLIRTAEFLEEEIFNLTKNLSSIIEPILIVIIGGAIGFFAISMLQPIYSIMHTI